MSKTTTTQNNRRDTPKRFRIVFNVLSILVIVGLIIYGITIFFHLGNESYTDDAQVEEYITPINVRIQGYIQSIHFNEHQPVHRGDTLVVIDDKEYKIQLEQALANLADVKAGKSVVQSDVDVSRSGVNVSAANLAEMKARLQNQETNLHRYENLLKEEVVSQFQFDQVKTEYDAMKAKYQALSSQLSASRLSSNTVTEKVAVSEAGILRAQAAVDLARLNLSYCYILAPTDGIIGRRKITEGQFLTPGQALATIVQSGYTWVTANYTEKQIENITIGDLVNMKIDAFKEKTFEGRVVAISAATGSKYSAIPVDNATGNFVKVEQRIPVKIEFTENDKPEDVQRIRAGMNVQVTKK